MPHTHVLHLSDHTAAATINLSKRLLVLLESGSVGQMKLTSRLISIQENIFMNACVYPPQ